MRVTSKNPFRLVISGTPEVGAAPFIVFVIFAVLFGLLSGSTLVWLIILGIAVFCVVVYLAFQQSDTLIFDAHFGTVEHHIQWPFGKKRVIHQLREVFGAHVAKHGGADETSRYQMALILTGMDEGLYHFGAAWGDKNKIEQLVEVINTWLRDVDLRQAEA
ncbi:hypothetical protein [Cognatiyoonia sp. IB215182]|uniref:hypothetical protein n=1 Tax=Cognatiyoonia sp. IB215182 TaxID=3097353 RepID=UPI002A143682|nr:hypothetical protein [Cognatiyoonia sp. IB215182]MDX8351632.1 hypothetical protein [Cognatiyoonia sp. IB215182]